MDDEQSELEMVDVYQLDLNSNEMCRNCLARNCQLKSLFRCDIIDGEIWPIPKVYQNVTNISVVENDNFPQNICTKCEETMFEAFMFKQKSVKSHNLLRKILKSSSNDKKKEELEPLTADRKSQSTQTRNTHENIDNLVKVTKKNQEIEEQYAQDEAIEAEIAEELGEAAEEEGDVNEIWQFVYENEESAVDETPEEIEPIELDIQDEMSSQSNDVIENTILDKSKINCEHCGEDIPRRQMSGHLKHHTKILPVLLSSAEFFRCGRCFMTFPFIDNLFEHFNEGEICEPSVNLTKDDICTDYQFLANEPPVRLFSTSKNDDINTYSCSLCVLDFEDLFLLQSHFEDAHLSSANCNPEYLRADLNHSCGICGSTFKTLHDALQHVYFHQAEYSCLYANCGMFFDSFSALYGHFTRDHPETQLECSHCTYLAKNTDDLKAHQRNLCSARNFKCDYCDKTFYKKSTLNMHLRTHTNDRKYRCSVCPKAFLQRNDLANHIRTHTLERPYKCSLCDKRFKTVGQRIGHMSTHTTEYNFQCDLCQKSFKSARILHGHKKIHGERQFDCKICEKKFNRRYHLTLHMKRHEKVPTKKSSSKLKKEKEQIQQN